MMLSHEGNPNLCPGGTSCGGEKKKNSSVAIIAIICVVSVVLLIVVIFIVWTVIKKRGKCFLGKFCFCIYGILFLALT